MTGRGAFQYGGRWNSPEHAVVYASGTLTLAMLEVLVHIDDAEAFLAKEQVYHAVRFDEDDAAVLEEASLPPGWNARPETMASQAVGDEFVELGEQIVLAVPSVVVPGDLRWDPLYMNYLVNPRHPRFRAAIEVGAVRRLDWDPRLAGAPDA